MFFFPYRIDANRSGIPFLTILICLLCMIIYWQQYSVDKRYFQSIEQFCTQDLSKREIAWLDRIPRNGSYNQCATILESIREKSNAEAEIDRLSKLAKPIRLFTSKQDNLNYIKKKISDIYLKFDTNVPENLTKKLVYDPHELDVIKMITSTFSHADLFHLLGNILFFYIFAASVEIIVGSLVFAGFITFATFGTSLAYSYSTHGVENALPTLGLSGVVMAALAALAVMMPKANIRCFFWFLLFYRIFRLPALFIAIWYIGWDVYSMNQLGNDSNINYIAHVSGAAIGGFLGVYYFLFRKSLLEAASIDY